MIDTQQMYSIAHSFAELAGRTRPDIHDLEQAFSDMRLKPSGLDRYIETASQSSKYGNFVTFGKGNGTYASNTP
jgi:hypothetical protein